jgi:hypothetical protein
MDTRKRIKKNNDLQNTTQKRFVKDSATRALPKPGLNSGAPDL